jgi:hypothetical protein
MAQAIFKYRNAPILMMANRNLRQSVLPQSLLEKDRRSFQKKSPIRLLCRRLASEEHGTPQPQIAVNTTELIDSCNDETRRGF